MNIWIYSLLAVGAVSLISFVGLFTLSFSEKTLRRLIFFIVSLSVGALLGDVFIHLLPSAFSGENNLAPSVVSLSVLAGLIFFFVLEKFLLWHHRHGHFEEGIESRTHDHSPKPLGTMVLFADGVHNFIDGALIAAGFLVSPAVGLATALAVILHEIPQEISDFGLLLHSGFSRARALWFNFLSAFTAVFGVVLTLVLGNALADFTPAAIAFAAGGFIYIAGSDLVPELQKETDPRKSLIQVLSILVGFGLMFLLLLVE